MANNQTPSKKIIDGQLHKSFIVPIVGWAKRRNGSLAEQNPLFLVVKLLKLVSSLLTSPFWVFVPDEATSPKFSALYFKQIKDMQLLEERI
jgi:hypothetical protein